MSDSGRYPKGSGGSQSGRGGSGGGSDRGSTGGRSRAGSTTSGTGPFPKGTGKDPAFDPNDPYSSRDFLTPAQKIGKRVDLPADAYAKVGGDTRYTKRPNYSSAGKAIKVDVNMYQVTKVPSAKVYQYDITVSPNPNDKDALIKKVWNSQKVQSFLRSEGGKWLYDGKKLAWSSKPIPRKENRMTVDLDAEAGKPATGRDIHYCVVRESKVIDMQYLNAYLDGKTDFDNLVLESLNFLDHLMRQGPSERLTSLKRNFYKEGQWHELSRDVWFKKGTYSAFRIGMMQKPFLGVNVDVANTAFWPYDPERITLAYVVQAMMASQAKNYNPDMKEVQARLRPVQATDKEGKKYWTWSEDFKNLRRLNKLKFHCYHRGKMDPASKKKLYTVKNIRFAAIPHGANAKMTTFKKKLPDGREVEKTVFDHFLETYNARLQYYDLPLVETTRGAFYPMEVCTLADMQLYRFKLSPDQTAEMIKKAVTRPPQRRKDIEEGVKDLGWDQDPYLHEFGVQIKPTMIETPARLLPNPEVMFAGSKINPSTSGRWDLRGRKFLEPNPTPLKSWAFIGIGQGEGGSVQHDQLLLFAQTFVRTYRGHGGRIEKDPLVKCYPTSVKYGEMCEMAYKACEQAFNHYPQFIFLVMPHRNQLVYERLKKNFDCRFALVSQVLQAAHVKKNNAQYHSNVAMKVNAKLGGATCRAVPAGIPNFTNYFAKPTMMLGMDVSHAAPGMHSPSLAAMSMSMDKYAAKWAGSCQTNGYRQELVREETMNFMVPKLLKQWANRNGVTPQHVYYMRDGVDEGQFQQVIEYEVQALKRIFRNAGMKEPLVTVIVATKRHHIRFFPKPPAADKNGNVFPGTLVEHVAANPWQWDFFLASHVAIQGTARPVHYHVIYDEAGCQPHALQALLYNQCYQYARATTPVSLHPAIYYAHLISLRARSHEDVAASNREMPSGKEGFPLRRPESELPPRLTASMTESEREAARKKREEMSRAPPLLPMVTSDANGANVQHINTSMWFI